MVYNAYHKASVFSWAHDYSHFRSHALCLKHYTVPSDNLRYYAVTTMVYHDGVYVVNATVYVTRHRHWLAAKKTIQTASAGLELIINKSEANLMIVNVLEVEPHWDFEQECAYASNQHALLWIPISSACTRYTRSTAYTIKSTCTWSTPHYSCPIWKSHYQVIRVPWLCPTIDTT